MQRQGGHAGQGDRNQKYRGGLSQGGFEDRRGVSGGYEDRRAGGDRHNNSRDRGGGNRGFEVRRSDGFEDRRGSQSRRPDSNHQGAGHAKQDRDLRKSEQGSSSGHNNSHHNGRQDRRPGDRDGATDRDRRERPGRDQPDPWTSWQRSKSTEREPPPKRDKRDASGAGPSRDRDGRTERRDERRPEADRRPGDRADRDRRDKREVEERRKRDEMRKVDERRREEEKRLEEIKRREAEIRREEEKLRRMEEESRREVQRRRDEERRREEERKRNEERDRERRRREEQRRRSPSPRHRVQRKSPPIRQRRERSAERRHSSSNKQSTSRRRSTSSSRRQSALDRLGPKIPVVTRLGGGKVSRKRRRPGSNERSSEQPVEPTEKDNMQITITGEKVEEEAGSGRKVARDVDIENFTVLDQVGEEDQEKPESSVEKQKKSNSKPETVVDLEKVVIKKRERKDERKSSDGKDFVIKKPSGLIAKLAKKKKDMPAVPTEVPDMTDQEKSEIRKKCRAKYAEEDQVTEKVISMSLDLVHFNEAETCLLIDSLLQEESEENVKMDSSMNTSLEGNKVNVETEDLHLESNNPDSTLTSVVESKQISQVNADPVPSVDDGHDELDFEAEEPDKVE